MRLNDSRIRTLGHELNPLIERQRLLGDAFNEIFGQLCEQLKATPSGTPEARELLSIVVDFQAHRPDQKLTSLLILADRMKSFRVEAKPEAIPA